MITRTGVRSLMESVGGDPAKFVRRWTHGLGLADVNGTPYRDHAGNAVLRDPADKISRIRPQEISLRGLAEGLLGEDAVERWLKPSMLRELMEDNAAGAIQASAFANINAFTAATAGLMEASILEAYQNPLFIADTLAPVEPSKQFEGRKTIGAARIGDQAEERLPGMPTKRVQIGERWIVQPRTVENALSCEVTQEAVYLDLTGQVVEHCSDVGGWLGYRKEIRTIDSFIGVVNSYNYKGTNYNTYISGGYYDNDLASNELLYIDNVQNAEIKFRDMKDPDTNTRILIQPNTVLVQQERAYTAAILFGGDEAQYRSAPGATSGEQSFRRGPNPIRGKYRVLTSPLVYERINAATGLNQSASDSGKYWWLFESGSKTHVYVQNWPLRVQTAAPNQLDMIDRGVVLYTKADERGVPMWKDPRRVVRCKP